MADAILHCLNLNLSMHFKVGSRSPAIFNMNLYVITVNSSFQSLPIFRHKELHLRCCIGLALNIVTWYTKILKVIRAHLSFLPHDWVQPWENMKNNLPWCPKYTYLEVFSIKFSSLYLISNGPDGVNNNSLK